MTDFGQPDFCPPWEVIEAHRHWYELTFLRGDDGAGVMVYVPDTADADLRGNWGQSRINSS